MDRETLKTIMCEIPQFNQLDSAELDIVAGYVNYRKVSGGTEIIAEGGKGESLFYIVSGKVGITKEGVSGSEADLGTRSRGTTIGEIALVDESNLRSATVTAMDDVELLVLTRDNFEKLMSNHPATALKVVMKIASQLSQRIRQLSGRLVDFLE